MPQDKRDEKTVTPAPGPERAKLNRELAQMLKGGVIMDVTTPEQARVAEEAGACAVMALERIPADIRAAGGVSRMSDPHMIKGIQAAVSIPVMAKCRIGHFVEAQVLQAIDIDYIDESEVLSPADDVYHIDKTQFAVPFRLRRARPGRGAAPHCRGSVDDPHQGRAGHRRRSAGRKPHASHQLADPPRGEPARRRALREAKRLQVPVELVRFVHENERLPVVNFAAGGVATPADAALMMQLGAEGVFVGSGIFKSGDPAKRARAIVGAVTNFDDPRRWPPSPRTSARPWLASTRTR
jgi:pyridoxal 5'-phosphate synthase pdxS subunit